jgi:hypothetical protein
MWVEERDVADYAGEAREAEEVFLEALRWLGQRPTGSVRSMESATWSGHYCSESWT